VFLNAWLPIDSRFEVGLIVKVERLLQLANAVPPIEVTESGRTNYVIGLPVKHS
jgi:hypothetical protein